MITASYDTLWEDFNNTQPPWSKDHGWASGPLTMLSQYVAGVAPTAPAFASFSVLPQLGDLTSVQATMASPKGTISVNISSAETQYSLAVTVPGGTKATVGIPTSAFSTGAASAMNSSVNGTQVFAAGTAKGTVAGVTYKAQDGGYVSFTVSPGTWNFSATPVQ